MSSPIDDPVAEAVRGLQRIRDEELEGTVESERAQTLLATILADPAQPEPEDPRRSRSKRWTALRRRGPAIFAVAGVLALAGGAGALLVRDDGPPSTNELRAGASNGVLDPGQTYVDVPIDDAASPAELRRQFRRLGYDIKLRLIPASPLLAGRIISASGDGGGELIRELRRDCPRATPCGRFGLKVPADFSGSAVIALGREADRGEPYVHVRSFQAELPHCIGLVGLRVGRAERLVESNLWPQANPLWFDVETGRATQETSAIRNMWVVDAVKAGGYLDEPSRSRPPRVVLAVARRPVPDPEQIRSGALGDYQQVAQQGC